MKSRFSTWLYVLFVVFIFGIANTIITNVKAPYEYVYFSVEDNFLKEKLADTSYKKMTLKPVTPINNEANFYVVKHFSETNDLFQDAVVSEDFKKYEYFYTSPIVMFVNDEVVRTDKSETGFTIVNPEDSTSYRRAKIDLIIVLNAILEDKQWSDLGVPTRVAAGKVSLVLPTENNSYYPYVEAMIYYTLNDYNELTKNDMIRLAPYVQKIIYRSQKVNDIVSYMRESNSNKNKNPKVILGPEYIISENANLFDAGNTYHWQPVYFPKTIEIAYDAYINKNNLTEEKLLNLLLGKNIYEKMRLRAVEPNYKMSDYNASRKMVSVISTYPINIFEFEEWKALISLPPYVETEIPEASIEETEEASVEEMEEVSTEETKEDTTVEENEKGLDGFDIFLLCLIGIPLLLFGLIFFYDI